MSGYCTHAALDRFRKLSNEERSHETLEQQRRWQEWIRRAEPVPIISAVQSVDDESAGRSRTRVRGRPGFQCGSERQWYSASGADSGGGLTPKRTALKPCFS